MTTRSGTKRTATKARKKTGSAKKSGSGKKSTSTKKAASRSLATRRAVSSPAPKRKVSATGVRNTRIKSRSAKASAKSEAREGFGSVFRFPLFKSENEQKPSSKRSVSRKKAASQPSRLVGAMGAIRKAGRDYEKMPTWRELDKRKNGRTEARPVSALDNISTVSLALIIAGFVAVFTLYIGNVHATQEGLSRLQTLQTQNSDLRMKLNRVKGDYDHMVGPREIYSRARQIGMIESDAQGFPVIVSPQ